MTYLAMVCALVLVLAWDGTAALQQDQWYRSWLQRVQGWNLSPAPGLALAILGPALLAYWVLDLLASFLFGVLWFAASVVVLLYAFGRGDFRAQMEQYRRQARSGNFEGAYLSEITEMPALAEGEDPATAQDVHAMTQRALLYEGFQRWFAVVFFFLLLGPVGALAYRLLQVSRESFEPELSARCLFLVDWVPARVLAATFVVTGHFVNSRDELLEVLQSGRERTESLLYRVGVAAIASPPAPGEGFGLWAAEQNEEFGSLLKRSAGAWLVLISLYVVLF